MSESQGSTAATQIRSWLKLVCPNLFFSPISEELSILKQAVNKLKWVEKELITRLEEFTYTDRLKDVKILERIL